MKKLTDKELKSIDGGKAAPSKGRNRNVTGKAKTIKKRGSGLNSKKPAGNR